MLKLIMLILLAVSSILSYGCADTEIIDGDEKIVTEGDVKKDKDEQTKTSGSTEKVDKVKITYGGVVVKEGEELVIYKTSEETFTEKKDTQNEETLTNTQTEIISKREIPMFIYAGCGALILIGILVAIFAKGSHRMTGVGIAGTGIIILGLSYTFYFKPDLAGWATMGLIAFIGIAFTVVRLVKVDYKKKA